MFRKSILIAVLVAMMAGVAQAQWGPCHPHRRLTVVERRPIVAAPCWPARSYGFSFGYSRRVAAYGECWGEGVYAAPAPAYRPAYASASANAVRQEVNNYSHTEVNIGGDNNGNVVIGGGAAAPTSAGAAPGGYYRGQYLGQNPKGEWNYDIPLPDGFEVEVKKGYVTDPHDD